ncbi:unnamed protein product [Moneuplotes crassus]|uniref:Uncharacterized protein n=1 Tax=Euplotes crassus TaxID=5936 RepID=A0AAD1UFH4_EUPCR|nr:unnamed protein product [Moneuplotes crassus]
MSNLVKLEENLSEELLNEDVRVSRVSMCPNLDKNMSRSLFKRKNLTTKLIKAQSLSPDSIYILDQTPQENLFQSKPIMKLKKGLTTKKAASFGPKKSSKLQNDIKTLLHRAIKIRNASTHNIQNGEGSKESAPVIPAKMGVTMRDVKKV